MGSASKTLAYATPSLAIVLLAAALARGGVVRATSRGHRAIALALGALALSAALVAAPNRPLVRFVHWNLALVAAITVTTLVGIALAARAQARSARPSGRAVSAAMLPLVVGATVAERVRASSVGLSAWSWSGLGFDVRGRILSELVEEIGVPFLFGLGGTAAVLVAAALLDAAKPRPPIVWRRMAPGLVLAVAARAVAWQAPIGTGLVLGAAVIAALAFLARGATRHVLVLAVVALDAVTLAGAIRDHVAMIAWEEGWPDRFAWIGRATSLLSRSPIVVAADVLLAILASARRPLDPAPPTVDRLRLFGLAFAGGGLLVGPARFEALIRHEGTIAARLTAAASAIGAPDVRSADRVSVAANVVAIRSGTLERSDIDDGVRWEPVTPRPLVLRVDPVAAILPRGITITEAGERLRPVSAPGAVTHTIVQASQPTAGSLAAAFVGPPLRSVPLVFDLPPEAFARPLYDGANVAAQLRAGRVAVFRVGEAMEEVSLDRAAEAVASRCTSPLSPRRQNGLLIIVGDRSNPLEDALRLAEALDPGLDVADYVEAKKCRFRAIAFIASAPP
jgi:hypothetical protein